MSLFPSNKFLQISIVLALALNPCEGTVSFRALDVLNQKQKQRRQSTTRSNSTLLTLDDDDDDVQELFIQQPLDHFRSGSSATFRQRYFYSDRFVRPLQEVNRQEFAFLCVGGEGPPLDKSVLTDSVHCSGDMLHTAEALYVRYSHVSIHLYALEHRYYGNSYPTFDDSPPSSSSPITNQHLVYLSSRQALEDLQHFVAKMSSSLTLDTQNSNNIRWVTFGGSYPGMLVAWARLKYPHLIHAAVSNSAPIQAQLDFPQYNNHVAYDLAKVSIGGSDDCYDLFVRGHAQLADAVQTNPQHVASLLGVCPDSDLSSSNPKNIQLLLGDGVFNLNTQSNDPSCTEPLCDIRSVCAAALEHYRHQQDDTNNSNTTAAMETLAWLVQTSSNNDDDDCTQVDWNQTLASLTDPTFDEDAQNQGWRSWLWQTCTEFGFYQTCETNSDCPYGKGWHPLSQDLEICRVAFNVTTVEASVQDTNAAYGGWQLSGSRILSVTGDVDPWTELALTKQSQADLPVYAVAGASHHFWTHQVQDSDSVEVEEARNVITGQVEAWLGLLRGPEREHQAKAEAFLQEFR